MVADFVFLVQTKADGGGGKISGHNLSTINKQVAIRSHQKQHDPKKRKIKSQKAVLTAQKDTQILNRPVPNDSDTGLQDVFELALASIIPDQNLVHSQSSSPRSTYNSAPGSIINATPSPRPASVALHSYHTSQYAEISYDTADPSTLSLSARSQSPATLSEHTAPDTIWSDDWSFAVNATDSQHNFSGYSSPNTPCSYASDASVNPAHFDVSMDCYSGLRTDPFLCMPVQDSAMVLSVAEKYTNVIIPNFRPIAKVFNVQDSYRDLFWELVFDEDTVDAVMAMVHGNESNMRKSANCAPSKELFLHLGNALKKLQSRLVDADRAASTATVAMLLYTAGVARHIGDFEAFERYKDMIRSLLRSMDGVEALYAYNGKVKCILLQWNFFWTLNGGTSLLPEPMIRKSRYPSLPLSYDLRNLIAAVPPGFKALAETGILSTQVLQLLSRVDRLVVSTRSQYESQQFLNTPLVGAKLDFQSSVPCLEDDDSFGPSLEKALCLALILFSTNTMNPIKPKKSVWGQVAVGSRAWLTANLTRFEPMTPQCEQCLVWIWLITIDSWGADKGMLLPEGRPVLENFASRFPHFTLDWNITSQIADKYFWSKDLDEFCQSIWPSDGF